jgi:formate hydrogenlyase subunit 6/NADH:ubiquinone oxidoreductase subunit I
MNSICNFCVIRDVCSRRAITQAFEKEVAELDRQVIITPAGIKVDNEDIYPKHYGLEDLGIRAKVECSSLLEKSRESEE